MVGEGKTLTATAQAIALAVRTAQQVIERCGLTQADVQEYLAYVERQHTLRPIIDPTAYMNRDRDAIGEARERAEIAAKLISFPVRGEGMLDSILAPVYDSDSVVIGYLIAPIKDE